jgi:hypothetical protein
VARMKLEVVIETDGEHCGKKCPLGDHSGMLDYCLGARCEYDYNARKNLRAPNCLSKAVECPE